MKKIYGLLLSGLLLSIFLVLASAVSAAIERVAVIGKIYGPDGAPVKGADVHVECDGAEKDTKSKNDGSYLVYFTNTSCNSGDAATVTATKDGASGTNEGIIGNNPPHPIDVAIVDVTIPEFGTITAGLALAGSGIGYAFIRRKMLSRKIRKAK